MLIYLKVFEQNFFKTLSSGDKPAAMGIRRRGSGSITGFIQCCDQMDKY
jgi:hypothetical protein